MIDVSTLWRFWSLVANGIKVYPSFVILSYRVSQNELSQTIFSEISVSLRKILDISKQNFAVKFKGILCIILLNVKTYV